MNDTDLLFELLELLNKSARRNALPDPTAYFHFRFSMTFEEVAQFQAIRERLKFKEKKR